jgi:hypothetical protein
MSDTKKNNVCPSFYKEKVKETKKKSKVTKFIHKLSTIILGTKHS